MAKYFVPLVAPPPMNNGGGGGSDLPAVSAADNGDVLTVVNGVWDKAAPGGGGGSSAVVPTFTIGDDQTVTCDLTLAQIKTAVDANTCWMSKVVFEDEDGAFNYANLTYYVPAGSVIVFQYAEPQPSAYTKFHVIVCSPDGFEVSLIN